MKSTILFFLIAFPIWFVSQPITCQYFLTLDFEDNECIELLMVDTMQSQ